MIPTMKAVVHPLAAAGILSLHMSASVVIIDPQEKSPPIPRTAEQTAVQSPNATQRNGTDGRPHAE